MAKESRKDTGKINKAGDKRGTLSTATQFKEGESGNPAGKKKGQRNYQTIYRLALERVAETKGMSADDIEMLIVLKGVERAIKGDYKFSQDILDRVHGKPVQTNLNKDINDVELDESELETMDAMLAKFMTVKKNVDKKKAAKKPAAK